jgi:biopolymer transport protein ExbD
MSRFRDSIEEGSDETAIDISPLMDCVFILLIFFIVTTTFNEEPGVEVNKPPAVTAEQLAKTSILIAVTAEGEVYYGGKNIGVSGVQRVVRNELKKDEKRGVPRPVAVMPDRNAAAEVAIQVVNEAKRAGAQEVSLATAGE